MKKLYVLLIIPVLLFAFGYYQANKGLNKPDEVLIRELFQKGEEAVESEDLTRAMSCISKNYKSDFGRNYDGLMLLARQAFQSEMRFDVQVDAPEITVNGDTAKASTRVAVNNIEGSGDQIFSGNMTFGLKKEPFRRYYIYPVKEWKITSFEGFTFSPEM